MPCSLLWTSITTFFATLPTLLQPIPFQSTDTPNHHALRTHLHTLQNALQATQNALQSERDRRAKWQRRALAARADLTTANQTSTSTATRLQLAARALHSLQAQNSSILRRFTALCDAITLDASNTPPSQLAVLHAQLQFAQMAMRTATETALYMHATCASPHHEDDDNDNDNDNDAPPCPQHQLAPSALKPVSPVAEPALIAQQPTCYQLEDERAVHTEQLRSLKDELEEITRRYTITVESLKDQQLSFSEQFKTLRTQLEAEKTISAEEQAVLKEANALLTEENNSLQVQLAEVENGKLVMTLENMIDTLHNKNVSLMAEVKNMRAEVAKERNTLAAELAQRTADFQAVAAELRDARETYISAAKEFENERVILTNKLTISENDKKAARESLDTAESIADDTAAKLSHFMGRCQRLENELTNLRSSAHGEKEKKAHNDESSRDQIVGETKSQLADSQTECVALRKQLEHVKQERDDEHRSEAGERETLQKRVQKLERNLEREYKKNASQRVLLSNAQRDAGLLREQVDAAAAESKMKEKQVAQLRKEMSAIHSRMRRMAHMSLPRGAEELLEEHDPDAQRLAAIRKVAREEEEADKASRRPRSVRRVRLAGNEND